MAFTDFADLPNPTGVDANGMVKFGDDRNMFVVFYRRSIEDPIASQRAGRRICKGADYIRIQPPGERLMVTDRPVRDEDKTRWRDLWTAYEQKHEQIADGTPIDQLWPDYPEIADTLRAFGVQTIEQCANLSGHAVENIGMGAQEYVNRARKYIESAEKGVQFHQHQKDLAQRDQKIRLQDQEIQLLKAAVQRLSAMVENQSMGPMAMAQRGQAPVSMQHYQPVMPNIQPDTNQWNVPLPPGVVPTPPPPYDVQSAQINALDEAKRPRGWPKGKLRGPRAMRTDPGELTEPQVTFSENPDDQST